MEQYAGNQTRTPLRTPSLFDKRTWVFYVRYMTHWTNGFTSHSKDEASWLRVLLKDTDVMAGTRTNKSGALNR